MLFLLFFRVNEYQWRCTFSPILQCKRISIKMYSFSYFSVYCFLHEGVCYILFSVFFASKRHSVWSKSNVPLKKNSEWFLSNPNSSILMFICYFLKIKVVAKNSFTKIWNLIFTSANWYAKHHPWIKKWGKYNKITKLRKKKSK